MSALNQRAPKGALLPERTQGLTDSCPCALAVDGGPSQAYNEEAFRYLLDVERKRSERSRRRFLLLLVDLKNQSGIDASIDAALASRLFAALSPCLRETDFIGWYREGRAIGAVLTQLTETPGTDISQVVSDRVNQALSRGRLPRSIDSQLQVRIYQLPPALESRT